MAFLPKDHPSVMLLAPTWFCSLQLIWGRWILLARTSNSNDEAINGVTIAAGARHALRIKRKPATSPFSQLGALFGNHTKFVKHLLLTPIEAMRTCLSTQAAVFAKVRFTWHMIAHLKSTNDTFFADVLRLKGSTRKGEKWKPWNKLLILTTKNISTLTCFEFSRHSSDVSP